MAPVIDNLQHPCGRQAMLVGFKLIKMYYLIYREPQFASW